MYAGKGAARAEDAQGTPTQSHISPAILVYEDKRLPVGAGVHVTETYTHLPNIRAGAADAHAADSGGLRHESVNCFRVSMA